VLFVYWSAWLAGVEDACGVDYAVKGWLRRELRPLIDTGTAEGVPPVEVGTPSYLLSPRREVSPLLTALRAPVSKRLWSCGSGGVIRVQLTSCTFFTVGQDGRERGRERPRGKHTEPFRE
jgi:hypothetical protein